MQLVPSAVLSSAPPGQCVVPKCGPKVHRFNIFCCSNCGFQKGEKYKQADPEPLKIVQILKRNDHLLTEDNHRYRVCKEYDEVIHWQTANVTTGAIFLR